ncbi:MAG: penicillin acylase family protein [Ignavibacteriales bacterium]|nr:penicillin acylase family protein [Ignavibacteriales bacterium]
MNSWTKNIIGIIFTIIIILLILAIGSIYMLRSSLPEYSGKKTIQNISDKIEIYRDDYGVAFINTETELDAYFALGYIHAQERLFQMDLSRRAGEGRLSEVLGSKTVFFDKMFKTLGLQKLVEENYQQYDETAKNVLIAYSNGVNEFIKSSPEKFTIEFDVLGYQPYLWKPEHSLLIAKLMAWELNISWWSDIALTHLIQKLGIEKVKDILPNFDENGPTIIPDEIKKYAEIPLELIKVDRKFREFIGSVGTHIGSNNWVVNGSRSKSGKPIIANDPHLSFAAPGKWYVADIHSPELKVTGFTLPGIPGVVIGKNQNISWVLTNVMADDADFYVEKLDSSKTNYFIDNNWQPLTIIEDTIHVKDSSDVIFTIRKNHRGPIISDIHTYNKLFEKGEIEQAQISMRWTALDFSNELSAFYKINHSNNWNEFRDALSLFHSPGQNFVYADVEGNIGYTAGVKLPIRKNNSPSFIFDGTTTESDWNGFVRFQENPQLYNPLNGFIASANNKTIKDYLYHISNVWEPTSRITRITELLNKKEKHNIEDFKKYQNDFYSHFARKIVPHILNAFNDYQINDENIKVALKILYDWDYVLTAESQVPTLYTVFFQYLMKNIFEDEMGEKLLNEYIFLANIPYRVVPKLLDHNTSDWFDNISTETVENRDEIIRKSFIDAIEYLEKNIDPDIKFWQWGKIHQVTFKHFFHGVSGFLDQLLDIGPFEIGGDGTTVFNTEYSLTKPFENKLGPSMRYIYDFANPDEFEFILPTGQSGHFFSDHYKDMTQKWLNGEYLKMNTNLDSIKNSNYKLLTLFPK